jgi:hypothetical protein
LAGKLKTLFAFDIHDLGVMVGGGFFCNAVASELSKWVIGAPLGHHLSLLIGILGFLAGGLLSQHVRRKQQLTMTIASQNHDREVTDHDKHN